MSINVYAVRPDAVRDRRIRPDVGEHQVDTHRCTSSQRQTPTVVQELQPELHLSVVGSRHEGALYQLIFNFGNRCS